MQLKTINLDNAYSLERRVRDEQKKKLGLREEILRIRAEREQVALRMDDIRIKHENEKEMAQVCRSPLSYACNGTYPNCVFKGRDSLNTAVHDIELAIELGKANQSSDNLNSSSQLVGTELLLKRIAGEVSNKGDSGGILRQIKEFNAFLERAAMALEPKKG